MSIFSVPSIGAVNVTNNTANERIGLTPGVIVLPGKTVKLTGTSIDKLKANYEAPGSLLAAKEAAGDLTFAVLEDADQAVGVEYFSSEPVTVAASVGAPGVTADFNFASAADMAAQNLDLGALIPAGALLLSVKTKTVANFTDGADKEVTGPVGTASAGTQFFVAAGFNATPLQTTTAIPTLAVDHAAATNMWIGGTPAVNWDTLTGGKVVVYATYIVV
jgi:hypothetical protein